MPRAGEDGVLALGAVDAEKLVGFVVGVGGAYGHYLHAGAEFELGHEFFLYIELLECHLAATFDFALVFAGLLCLDFDGRLRAAVLEFDF